MKKIISALLTGIVFGLGISLAGMANPAKIINFFDVFGHWDPSLAFVMGGAVIVTYFGYALVHRSDKPLFEEHFALPQRQKADFTMITGAAIFGIGWGLAGFCPGGALPALGTARSDVLLFVVALVVGMVITRAALAKTSS